MIKNLLRLFSGEINAARNIGKEKKQDEEPAKVVKNEPSKVPVKFQSDINTLVERYGELVPGKRIVISLHDALAYLPRDRKRVDAYGALAKWLKENRDVELIVESNKTQKK